METKITKQETIKIITGISSMSGTSSIFSADTAGGAVFGGGGSGIVNMKRAFDVEMDAPAMKRIRIFN